MGPSSRKRSEPRAHHFLPQCWLAGFTDTGLKNGRLFVTDLKRRKQWPTSPPNAGHRRDFYRVSEVNLDPVAFERAFSKIEDVVAPILRDLYYEPREPDIEELDVLLSFAAIQHIRVPSFRPTLLRIADNIHRSTVAGALKNPASWAKALKKAGIPPESPGADYQGMLAYERDVIKMGQYSVTAENEFYLFRGLRVAANSIMPSFNARHWQTLHSPSGSFIGSDNPVVMDGPKGRMVGFNSADVIIFTINRYLALYGTNVPARHGRVNRRLIAGHNTASMLEAEEQLYSCVADFCWLDSRRDVHTDWRAFSRESVIESISA
jgi:hypothetical protein